MGMKNVLIMNRIGRILLLVSLLLVSVVGARAQRGPVNRWNNNTGLGNDESGNQIFEREDFDFQEPAPHPVQGALPKNWTQHFDHLTSGNNQANWVIHKGGGYLTINTSFPSAPASGTGNALFYSLDDVPITTLISPITTLTQERIKAPGLRFKYAAASRDVRVDELKVFYRFGNNDPQWKQLKTFYEAQQQWTSVTIPLKEEFLRQNATKEQLDKVQFGFQASSHYGFGIALDEVMIVELEGRPVVVTGYSYNQLSNPVACGTKLNELARIEIELSAGSGLQRLKDLALEYTGDKAEDIEKLYLYRTMSPAFSTSPENRLCDLTFSGGKITGFENYPNGQQNIDLQSGKHYLWIVADIKSDAQRKNKISFKMPKDAVKLEYYSAGVHGQENDKTFPGSELSNNGNYCKVYQLLLQEGFENGTSDWQLSNSGSVQTWHIAVPLENYVNGDPKEFRSRPLKAYAGSKVLATGELKDGKIYGGYPSNISQDHGSATYTKGVDATYNYNVLLKMKYQLNLGSGDRVRVQVKGKANGQQEDWSTVWDRRDGIMSGWYTLVLDISEFATRRSEVQLRFLLTSNSDTDRESGLYVDEMQMLADYIQHDVGIVKVERPAGMVYTNDSKIKVTLKNFGKEKITKPIKVKVTGSGRSKEITVDDDIEPGATKEVEIDGLNLAPKVDSDNEMRFVIEAVLEGDDDPSNNSQSLRFYSYPTFEVSKEKAYPTYPKRRMEHWFAESLQGGGYSWKPLTVQVLEAPFNQTPLYSHFVWKTGATVSYRGERSTLTGPVFDLKGTEKKQLVVGYTMVKGVKLRFEYRKENEDWQKLTSSSDKWSKEWYTDENGWNPQEDMSGYKQAKVELPMAEGKIQLRAVFEGLPHDQQPNAGVAINGVEVRCIRPDYRIDGHSPVPDCSKPMGKEPLKLKVKNNGPVNSEQLECPVEVQISEYTSATEKKFISSELVTVTLPAMNVNETKEVATNITLPWDYSAWGYSITATLRPDLSVKKEADEDVEGNKSTFDIRPLEPAYLPIDINPKTKKYYVANFPHTMVLLDKPGYSKWSSLKWESVSGGATIGSDGVATAAGQAKLKYNSVYTVNGEQKSCPEKTLEFEIATSTNQIKVILSNAESFAKGCYTESGETINVTLKNEGERYSGSLDIVVLANGEELIKHNQPSVEVHANASSPFALDNVKLPKGYSQVVIFVELNNGNQNFTTNSVVIDRVFRWAAPEDIDIFVRNAEDETDLTRLPSGNEPVVANYTTKRLQLYVPPQEGVSYKWYRGNTPDAINEQVSTDPFCYLGEVSAYYQLEITYGSCASKRYEKKIHVLSDDIEVVAFTGVAGDDGVCRSEDGVKLSVDVRNHSRTTYQPGTELEFKLTFSSGSPEKTFKVPLKEVFPQMGTFTVELPTLNKEVPDQLKDGPNRLKIEFLTIGGNPDGNKENNVLEQDVRLKPTPTVTIGGQKHLTVKRKFLPTDNYSIEPEYSVDSERFAWWSQMDNNSFQPVDNTGRNYTISGIPHDTYKVVATNNENCSAEATVTFIQTDIAAMGIPYPKSACKLEENDDRVEVTLKNAGSKRLLPGTQIDLTLKLGEESIATATYSLPSELGPDAETTYIFTTPGIKERLKDKKEATISVLVKLKDIEDIDEGNGTASQKLVAFGYPQLTVTAKFASVGRPETIERGKLYNLYLRETKFTATVMPVGGATVLWKYQKSAGSTDEKINENSLEQSLPTEATRNSSEDKRGSGLYFVVAENSYGCRDEVNFHLNVQTYDLALAQVDLPQSACRFDGTEKLKVQIENKGTMSIEAGTKIDIEVEREVKGQKTTKKEQQEMPATLPTNGRHLFEIPIDLVGSNNEFDNQTFKFTVKVAFVDEQLKEFDTQTNADNNSIKEAKTVEDYQDMQLQSVRATSEDPSPLMSQTDLTEGQVFQYKETYESGGQNVVNKVTLTPTLTSGVSTYQWELGGGIKEMDNPWNPSAQSIKVRGGGKVCVTVASDKGCSDKRCVVLRTNSLDLVISRISKPESKCIGNGHNNEPVQVVVTNVGIPNFNSQTTVNEEGFDVGYKITGPDGFSYEPTTKVKVDLKNTQYFPSGELKSGDSVRIDLPNIQKMIDKAGKYTVVAQLYGVTGESDLSKENNSTTLVYEYYSAPSLDGKLGENDEPFYAPTGTIAVVDPNEEAKYTEYKWTDANGAPIAMPLNPTPSTGIVTEAGTYTLTFKDAYGCVGTGTKSVKFPAYLEFVDGITSPKSACDYDGNQSLEFQVRNAGKEPYVQPNGGIPFNVKYNTQLDPKTYSLPESIPAGGVATVVFPNFLDLSADGDYELEVAIGDGADGSQTVTPESKRPKRLPAVKTVTNYRKPGLPRLAEQAEMWLTNLGHAGAPLQRIPKGVTFPLSALIGTGDSPDVMMKTSFYWIRQETDSTEVKFWQSGNYQVRLTNEHGCEATTDALDLRYIVEYAIEALVDGFSAYRCVDQSSPTKEVPIAVSVNVKTADEPIPTGTEFLFSYLLDGSTTPVTGSTTLDRDYAQGEDIKYTFPVVENLAPGMHSLVISTQFKDKFNDVYTAVSPKEEIEFYVNPYFTFAEKEVVAMETLTITAPEVTPPGTYTYTWNGEVGGETYQTSVSGVVELVVTSTNGCSAKDQMEVLFQKKLTIISKGDGVVRVDQLNQADEPVREVVNGGYMDAGRKILITLTPQAGNALDYLFINDSRQSIQPTGYVGKYEVTDDVKIDVGFRVQSEEETAVGSSLLTNVQCVSPFSETLLLLNAEHVVRYEVLNQLGQRLLDGVHRPGEGRIVIPASHLSDGLYLIRLTATDGGVAVLRAVKSR